MWHFFRYVVSFGWLSSSLTDEQQALKVGDDVMITTDIAFASTLKLPRGTKGKIVRIPTGRGQKPRVRFDGLPDNYAIPRNYLGKIEKTAARTAPAPHTAQ